jgi:hypothetical protein
MKNCLLFKALKITGTDIVSILIFFPPKNQNGWFSEFEIIVEPGTSGSLYIQIPHGDFASHII